MKGGAGHQCLLVVELHHSLAAHPFLPGTVCKDRGPSITQQTANLTKFFITTSIEHMDLDKISYRPLTSFLFIDDS